MSRILQLADRLTDACKSADVFVLHNIWEHGFDDDDMLVLYGAARDKTSELYMRDHFHGGVICTSWLHAARVCVASASSASKQHVECLLDTAFDLVVFLGQRDGVPDDGSFEHAIRGLLHLGMTIGVDHIAARAHSLRCYGGWDVNSTATIYCTTPFHTVR